MATGDVRGDGTRRADASSNRRCRPLILDRSANAPGAFQLLVDRGQAMAFVAGPTGLAGVVTVEDLRFAVDWKGPAATVADAMTFGLVEVAPDADSPAAAEAFAEGLRRWIHATHRDDHLDAPSHHPPDPGRVGMSSTRHPASSPPGGTAP